MSKFSIAVRLFIITAVAAVCLAAANKITAPLIEENAQKTKNASMAEVLPAAKGGFTPADAGNTNVEGIASISVYSGYSDKEQKNIAGYVAEVTCSEGYGGDITVMVGLDTDCKVVKAVILSSSETAGLGAKAKEPEFINQFIGKSGGLIVVKGDSGSDNEISAITSATITSKAVTKCVNTAVEVVKESTGKSLEAVKNTTKVIEEKDAKSNEELKAAQDSHKDEAEPIIEEAQPEGDASKKEVKSNE